MAGEWCYMARRGYQMVKKLCLIFGFLLVASVSFAATEFDANADGVFDEAFKFDVDNLVDGTTQIPANSRAILKAADYSAIRTLLGLVIGTHVQAYDADIPTVAASQEEMEAGTEATLRSMSPLRVAQAIAALGGEGTDTIGWAYTALTAAPTGGALIAGKVYRANNDDWDPITYAGTDDYFVLWTGSAWVGIVDINGNWLLSSTSLLTAAAPTIDAAGEVAIDTTSDQLVYYGGAKRAIPYKQYVSAVIPAPADTDDINLLKAPYGMTILAINCIVQGTTSVTGQLQECDSAGANCADLDSDITCDADGADDGTLTDSAIASGAWLRWKTTSVSGTPTFLTVTATYSVVSD